MQIKRDWSKLGWAVVWFVWACIGVWHGFEHRREIQQFQAAAKTTKGIVTHAFRGFKSRDDAEPPYIEYEFTVNGKKYSGSSVHYIPNGDPVEVMYSPSNPNENFAVGNSDGFDKYFFMAMLMGGFGFLLAMMGFSSETAKRITDIREYPLEPSPFLRLPIVIIGAMSAFMLYNAPDQHAYWYFQLLRWLVCIAAAMFAYYSYQWRNPWAPWLFGAIAVLFNPLVPFYFERRAWAIIDVASAIVMIAAAYFAEPPKPQSTQ